MTNDAAYNDDYARAERDGTVLPERADDMPPPNLFHAARALADVLTQAIGGANAASTMDIRLDAPQLWGMLDIERAAALVAQDFPDAFPALVQKFPWLSDAAGEASGDAIGALGDAF